MASTVYPGAPHGQVEIAKLAGFEFREECNYTIGTITSTQMSVNAFFDFDVAQPPLCYCEEINGKRCYNGICRRFTQGVSCSEACGNLCQNQKLQYQRTAIKSGKIALGYYPDVRGRGLFAHSIIDEGEILDEFVGIWKPKRDIRARNYAYDIGINGIALDALVCGSAVRCVNHSCVPNCMVKVVMEEEKWKVVYVALRRIARGEELTVSYQTKYSGHDNAIRCHCGHRECKKWIGVYQPKVGSPYQTELPLEPKEVTTAISNDPQPNQLTGRMLTEFLKDSYTKRFPKLLRTDDDSFGALAVSLQQRDVDFPINVVVPPEYIEDHVFDIGTKVVIFAHFDGEVVITGATVLTLFCNLHGVHCIKVWINNINRIITLPKCFVFRHAAKASQILSSFNLVKDQRMLDYFQSGDCGKHDGATSYIMESYMVLWKRKKLPRCHMSYFPFSGAVGLGLPPHILTANEDDDRDEEDFDLTFLVPNIPIGGTCPNPTNNSDIIFEEDVELTQDEISNFNLPVSSAEMTVTNEKATLESKRVAKKKVQTKINPFTLDIDEEYNIDYRKKFSYAKSQSEAPEMCFEIFENRVEEVTFFYRSRTQGPFGYFHNQEKIRKYLHNFYYNKQKKFRQYILFEDYKANCENLNDGATGWFWCNLCEKKYAYNNAASYLRHFYDNHMITSMAYPCKKCRKVFPYPSMFVKHLETCQKHIVRQIRADTCFKLLDSISDVVCLRDGASRRLFTSHPGMPYGVYDDGIDMKALREDARMRLEQVKLEFERLAATLPPEQANKFPQYTATHILRSRNKHLPEVRMNLKTNLPRDMSVKMRPILYRIHEHYTLMQGYDDLRYGVNDRSAPQAQVGVVFPAEKPKFKMFKPTSRTPVVDATSDMEDTSVPSTDSDEGLIDILQTMSQISPKKSRSGLERPDFTPQSKKKSKVGSKEKIVDPKPGSNANVAIKKPVPKPGPKPGRPTTATYATEQVGVKTRSQTSAKRPVTAPPTSVASTVKSVPRQKPIHRKSSSSDGQDNGTPTASLSKGTKK